MSELKSEQGFPTILANWIASRNIFNRPFLSLRQRTWYAAITFIMGITYLKVLTALNFRFSWFMLIFTLLGGMCFLVCFWNLVAIWQQKNQHISKL